MIEQLYSVVLSSTTGLIWQDLVFMLGGFIGAGILLPTLLDAETKVPIYSSFLQVILITVFTYTFWTLGLTLSAMGSSARVAVWIGIAALRR